MKAVVLHELGGIDKMRLEEFPVPQIGPQDVLVRVKACGVNRLDIMVRTGRSLTSLPHILGSEVAGQIEGMGDQVTGLSVGQAVAIAPYLFCGQCEYCLAGEETLCRFGDILGMRSNGGYAEFVKAPAQSIVPLPPGVSFDDAAAVTLAAPTAWHMLVNRAALKPGEDVLVLAGGSGIGSAAIQIAKHCGCRVIATASTQEKLDKSRELGADEVINYREQDFYQEVRRITDRRGVDVVVEHVGSDTWEKSVASLARNGRLVTCGATTGNEGKVDIWTLFAKQLSIIGAYGGSRNDLQQVLKQVARGVIKPVIHQAYPLEQFAEAQRVMEDREQFGKLIINP